MNEGYIALNVFVLAALCLIFIFPLLKKLKRRKIRFREIIIRPRVEFGMFYIFLFTAIAILYIVMIHPAHKEGDPDERLEYLRNENLPELTFFQYQNKTLKDRYDYESVFYMHYYKKMADDDKSFKEISNPLRGRSVKSSYDYRALADTSTCIDERDLGYFGYAVVRLLYYNDKKSAHKNLDRISIKEKPFVHCLYSLASNSAEDKIYHFKKEIKLKGAVHLAVEELSKLYWELDDQQGFGALYSNPQLQQYIPVVYKEEYAFNNFHPIDYLKFELERIFKHTNSFIIYSVLLILCIWLFFLLGIDSYEKEKTHLIVLTFGLGIVMTIVTMYFYELVHHFKIYEPDSGIFKQLVYFIGVVGGIEELMKIIPLFIIMRFTKAISEPIDYIFYAGVSALTFSLMEDVMYFNNFSVKTIYGRAVFTSLAHISLSSIVAYSVVLANYFFQNRKIVVITIGFLIACTVHGIYDYFASLNFAGSNFITTFLLCLEMWWLTHAANNCLNNSEHYSDFFKLNVRNISIAVSGGLFLLIIFVYVNTAIHISEDYAAWNLFNALIRYSYPIFFFKICIKRIDIFKGEWDRFGIKKFLDPKFFFAGIHHKYWELVGQLVIFTHYGSHTKRINEALPIKASVNERIKIGKYRGWFKITLHHPIYIDDKFVQVLFFRTKTDEEPIDEESKNLVALYTLKDPELLHKKSIDGKDLSFVDWVYMQQEGMEG